MMKTIDKMTDQEIYDLTDEQIEKLIVTRCAEEGVRFIDEPPVMKTYVKEEYLVDAFSYTECEARIIEEMKPFISGEFSVDIKRFRIAELFAMDGDRFYKVTADYITIDEKSNNEKRKAFNYIVQANDLDHAKKNFEEGMKGTISDFVVTCIKEEKKLMDFYEFDGKIRNPEKK